jgi:transcriptional regulator with XRE-family HTH domain
LHEVKSELSDVVPIRAEVGARLRTERRRLGLNQADFGRLADVSRRTQAGYEAGEVAPDAEYLSALSLAGVDVLYVVTGRNGPPPVTGVSESQPGGPDLHVVSDDQARLLESFRQMTASDRVALLRLAKSLADRARNNA